MTKSRLVTTPPTGDFPQGFCDIRHRRPQACVDYIANMNARDEILERYEPLLAAISVLDHAYYTNTAPTAEDRSEYFARKKELENIRERMYQELKMTEIKKPPQRLTFICFFNMHSKRTTDVN